MINQAVINDTHVWHNERCYCLAGEGAITPTRLLTLAERLNVKSLWVTSGSAISESAMGRDWLAPAEGWTLGRNPAYIRLPRLHQDALISFSGWREQETHTRHIMFPRVGDTWELAEASSPPVLLAALDYIEQALGLAPFLSAGYTGQALMKRINIGGRHSWTAPVDLSSFPEMLEATRAAQPFAWHRAPTPDEQQRPYLVAIDKNSAWPAACTGVELGIGAPRHVTGREMDGMAGAVGCYRAESITPPPALSCLLPTLDEIAPDGWLWSPTLAALRKLGYDVRLAEGYCWQESRTILRPWAERIWQARQSVRDDAATYPNAEARGLAQNAIKKVANVGLQWLDLRGKDFSTENAYHRPDWYALVRDRARAAQLEQIAHFASKYHLAPVMIHVDALYYAVESPDIEQSMPGVLARSRALGGYKDAFAGAAIPLASFADLLTDTSAHPLTVQRAIARYLAEHAEA
jgi:hypothetical protein